MGVCVGAEAEEEEPMTRPGVEKLSGLLDEREQRLPIFLFSFFFSFSWMGRGGGRWWWMDGWDGMG